MNNQSDEVRGAARHKGWKRFLDRIGGGAEDYPDERIGATRQRWAARCMYLMTFMLNIDLIIRSWFLKQSSSQFMDIAVIWLAGIFLFTIGVTASGVEAFSGRTPRGWIFVAAIVALNAIFFLIIGAIHSPIDLLINIAVGTAAGSLLVFILHALYALWERRTLGNGSGEE